MDGAALDAKDGVKVSTAAGCVESEITVGIFVGPKVGYNDESGKSLVGAAVDSTG